MIIDSASMKGSDSLVVISDMHLGANNCILNDEGNVKTLVKEIKDEAPKEVILLGDILDFFMPLGITCSKARVFFKELKEVFKEEELRVTYIPGNHDHHIWTYTVESEFFIGRLAKDKDPEDDFMKNAVNAGPYAGPDQVPFLNKFYGGLRLVYPHAIRESGTEKYYFTHGHLQDNIFTLGSAFEPPKNLAELEAFNAWWTEGGWFYMGQSGRLAEEFRKIYETPSLFPKLIDGFHLGAKFCVNELFTVVDQIGYKVKRAIKKPMVERAVTPPDIEKYIRKYVSPEKDPLVEPPFHFVYGHTHKHEEEPITVSNHNRSALNTGTWLAKDEKDREHNGFYVIRNGVYEWKNFQKNH